MIHREDGFTLIEVLIGTILGATLMATLASVFLTGFQAIRVSQDTHLAQDDVQTLQTYLVPDVRGATRSIVVASTATAETLTLTVPEQSGTGRVTTVVYEYDAVAGTMARTLTSPGAPAESDVVARSLRTAETGIFAYCATGAGCPKVTVTLPLRINGQPITRVLTAAPRLSP